MNTIKNLIRGNKLFRQYHFEDFKDEISHSIKHGQKPEVLFIGCCDSRVTPDFMLGSKPGELFVLRNIGNFVPPCGNKDDFHSSSAAIEYAVSVLEVKHIIVCGHSHCGACKSLYEDIPKIEEFQNIHKWLELGAKAKEITLKNKDLYKSKEEFYRATEKNSIKQQLKNLLTYKAIKEKVKDKKIQIHGWHYNLADGFIEYYDKENDTFKDVIELEFELS